MPILGFFESNCLIVRCLRKGAHFSRISGKKICIFKYAQHNRGFVKKYSWN
ncbi:hypothetical protein HMPREF1870_01298 [Bacteroidales bacterium KA00344]|nr:hypothetical protein HMPREF1870_01298 [Bacteroidales bacterium KA00344]